MSRCSASPAVNRRAQEGSWWPLVPFLQPEGLQLLLQGGGLECPVPGSLGLPGGRCWHPLRRSLVLSVECPSRAGLFQTRVARECPRPSEMRGACSGDASVPFPGLLGQNTRNFSDEHHAHLPSAGSEAGVLKQGDSRAGSFGVQGLGRCVTRSAQRPEAALFPDFSF